MSDGDVQEVCSLGAEDGTQSVFDGRPSSLSMDLVVRRVVAPASFMAPSGFYIPATGAHHMFFYCFVSVLLILVPTCTLSHTETIHPLLSTSPPSSGLHHYHALCRLLCPHSHPWLRASIWSPLLVLLMAITHQSGMRVGVANQSATQVSICTCIHAHTIHTHTHTHTHTHRGIPVRQTEAVASPLGSSGPSFSVVTYNVLAQDLIHKNPNLYTHCPESLLDWEYRKHNLMRELVESDAEVRREGRMTKREGRRRREERGG